MINIPNRKPKTSPTRTLHMKLTPSRIETWEKWAVECRLPMTSDKLFEAVRLALKFKAIDNEKKTMYLIRPELLKTVE